MEGLSAAKLRASVKEAVVSLYAAKQRSLLALIGIVVGIGSVIAIVSIGEVAKRHALEQFKDLGTEFLSINTNSAVDAANLAAALALPEEAASIAAAAPWLRGSGRVIYEGKERSSVEILGVTGNFTELNKLQLEQGRDISDLDYHRYFCVVGAKIAAQLREAGATQLIGDAIRLGESGCTIVGVLKHRKDNFMQSFKTDELVLLPFSTGHRMFPGQATLMISARMGPDAHYAAATTEVEEYFRRTIKTDQVWVLSAQNLIDQIQGQMQTFALLLAAIGSISLIVGGVGVMNVMLVSVTERRKEIGIRRALGARRADIQSQFLIESVVLSLIGGSVGILLGVACTWIYCRFTGWAFLVDPGAMAAGFLVAFCVGVFFGILPAVQAAKLDPIAALRAN